MTNRRKQTLGTFLIIFGILFFYVMQMSPSPVLSSIQKQYGITSNAVLNLAVNIIFVTIVIGSVTGGAIEKHIGTRRLYGLALACVSAGCLACVDAYESYTLLLAGRLCIGLGFGFAIPFIGSAIMKWFPEDRREAMDTVNSIFPFIGTTICFLFTAPLCSLFADCANIAVAVWGIPVFLTMLIWAFAIHDHDLTDYTLGEQTEDERHVFKNLWRRREIKLLCITFCCDFTCYSYIGAILPTFILLGSTLGETSANLLAAIAFPLVGLVGSTTGGVIMTHTGRRKPMLLAGQIGKFVGIMICTLGATSLVTIVIGAAIFGFFNGFWMPSLYASPMSLKDMNAHRVGAAFALMTACALTFGFISPEVGGALTDGLMGISGAASTAAAQFFGLRWSLFIFGFVNIIGIICMALFPETGERHAKEHSNDEASAGKYGIAGTSK